MTARITRDVLLEQAIAYQHSIDWMVENLGVQPAEVDEARRRLDRINASPDCEPAAQPYRKTGAK